MTDLMLIKQACALAASMAIRKADPDRVPTTLDLIAVEEAVEEACTKLRLQSRAHQEVPSVWQCCRCNQTFGLDKWVPWKTRYHQCLTHRWWYRPYYESGYRPYVRAPRRKLITRGLMTDRRNPA